MEKLLTQPQRISIAESLGGSSLSKAYDQGAVILQECPTLNLNVLANEGSTHLSDYIQTFAATTITTTTSHNLSTLCKTSLVLIVADLNIHEPLQSDFKILFTVIKQCFQLGNTSETTTTAAAINTIGKDIITYLIKWYKKAKNPTVLPTRLIQSLPVLLVHLNNLNQEVMKNVGQLGIVWKKGIIGLLKMRAAELVPTATAATAPTTKTTTTTSTSSSSSSSSSSSLSLATTTTNISTLMDSIVSHLFQNLKTSITQLNKELNKNSSSTAVDNHVDNVALPPAFKLVRFWFTNMNTLAKHTPMECARIFPKHATTLLNVMALVHPVFGTAGASKIHSSSMQSFLSSSTSSVLHLLLSSPAVTNALKTQLLIKITQPSGLPQDTTKQKSDPRDVSRLWVLSELLVNSKQYNQVVRRQLYTLMMGYGDGSSNGSNESNESEEGSSHRCGMITLIKRCYSQIVLMDQQVTNVLKRGVVLQGSRIVYNHHTPVRDGGGSGGSGGSGRMNGVADWENNEPSSLLLKTLVSVVTFVGHAPFSSTTNELTHYMHPLVATYLMDGHPAVVEIGATALSALVQRLPPNEASDYLSAMVQGVLSSLSCSLIDVENPSSSTGSVLRAVNRALPLLTEQGMNAFCEKCLVVPSIATTTIDNDNEEMFKFLAVLRYLFLDSLPQCQHLKHLYTKLLTALVTSLSNNTLLRTTTNLSNTTSSNAPKLFHIPSLSRVRLTIDIIQRLTSFPHILNQNLNQTKQTFVMKQLWSVGKVLLPYLAKEMRNGSGGGGVQQQQQHALVEATFTSAIGMYSTSVVLKQCPSGQVIEKIVKHIGNQMKAVHCLSTTKLSLGYCVFRILNEMNLQSMTWYEMVKKPKSSSSTSGKSNKRKVWNVQFNKALRVVVEELVKEANVLPSGGSSRPNPKNWALFHCGLNVGRACMYVLDIDDVTSTIVPTELLEYVMAYMDGTSKSRHLQPPSQQSILSEDVLQTDQRILMQHNGNNSSSSTTSSTSSTSNTSSNANVSYQHPLLTSVAALSKIRKAKDGMVEDRRPTKRARLDPRLTSALPMQLNNMLHQVRDSLVDLQEYVLNDKRGAGNHVLGQETTAKQQWTQCVGQLQTILSSIGGT